MTWWHAGSWVFDVGCGNWSKMCLCSGMLCLLTCVISIIDYNVHCIVYSVHVVWVHCLFRLSCILHVKCTSILQFCSLQAVHLTWTFCVPCQWYWTIFVNVAGFSGKLVCWHAIHVYRISILNLSWTSLCCNMWATAVTQSNTIQSNPIQQDKIRVWDSLEN